MERKIRISAGAVTFEATLNGSPLAEKTWEALPIEAAASTWGEEIYFRVPVSGRPEKPVETVSVGDIGYWPEGECLCFFFGPTPASRGEEIRPASPVEVIGRVTGDALVLRRVAAGERVLVERAPGDA